MLVHTDTHRKSGHGYISWPRIAYQRVTINANVTIHCLLPKLLQKCLLCVCVGV